MHVSVVVNLVDVLDRGTGTFDPVVCQKKVDCQISVIFAEVCDQYILPELVFHLQVLDFVPIAG